MKLIKTNGKNGENVSHLKITEVVLVHCINFNNDYKHDSRVFCIFAPNKSFCQLLDISPELFYFLFYNSEFSFIEV